MSSLLNVDQVLSDLTLDEKVKLLAGRDTWGTFAVERLNVPSLTVGCCRARTRCLDVVLTLIQTDNRWTTWRKRHVLFQWRKSNTFVLCRRAVVTDFSQPPGALLPSATAMGATFDTKLMRSVGKMLATEVKEKECQILLAPTVCLQRSPLIGRGFEAFGEDPILSGLLASEYINGVQQEGVAASIKHYAVHDQSSQSNEDDVRAAERTLRETHLLPFQLAVKHANPWSFMSSYHRINGVLTSEDPWLNTQLLRQEWGWDGLVMSDWGGTYSTAEAVNAGLDLEMPGPTRWRGERLHLSIVSRKVKKSTIDERVRNMLNIINKVRPAFEYQTSGDKTKGGDTLEKRELCREVARSSIVLLKNEKNILPLDPTAQQTYGLIGPGVTNPAVSGGGSANLVPYYVSKPLQAIQGLVGKDRVKTAIGCYCEPSSSLTLFFPLESFPNNPWTNL